jgi:hypothetical protein
MVTGTETPATWEEVQNSLLVTTMHAFVRIFAPILLFMSILEILLMSFPGPISNVLVLIVSQTLLLLFLAFAGAAQVTPKTLTFQSDGIIIATRKGWFPLLTPARKLSIGYDKISRVYEGSLTTRPAFVLVGARVLPGNWEERYFVTRRIARLLRKNWEAHKLGHAMQ